MKHKKIIYLSLCLATQTMLAPWLAFAEYKVSPHEAARRGDLDTLRQYRFDGVDLFLPDARGFTPYELAALHANPDKEKTFRKHVETMLWLKEFQPEKHQYGKASIRLIQAALNALGYDVGAIDGMLGGKTTEAIRNYQKDNDLAQTGKPGPQWLGVLYQDAVKDVQFKLTQLGFNTYGTDGLMGPKTEKAMLTFRESMHLDSPDYPHVDALLISKVNQAFEEKAAKERAALAEKLRAEKLQKNTWLQAGLRMLGYRIGKIDGMLGSKTTNAIKQFQSSQKLKVTGELDSATETAFKAALVKDTQKKLNVLGYRVGTPDGKMGKKTELALTQFCKKGNLKINNPDRLTNPSLLTTLANAYERKLTSNASKTASRAENNARKKAKAKKAEAVIKTATLKPKTEFKIEPVKLAKTSESLDVINKKESSAPVATRVGGRFARGSMVFERSGGRVVGCSIAGRSISIEWCEPFYPLPKNNHCEATFKPGSGTVINLWCK